MATNVTFKAYTQGPDGRGGEVSATISLNDVSVNTTPNSTGGWNTATVTADKQQRIYIGPTDAASSGLPQGWYENAGDHFRRQHRGPNFK